MYADAISRDIKVMDVHMRTGEDVPEVANAFASNYGIDPETLKDMVFLTMDATKAPKNAMNATRGFEHFMGSDSDLLYLLDKDRNWVNQWRNETSGESFGNYFKKLEQKIIQKEGAGAPHLFNEEMGGEVLVVPDHSPEAVDTEPEDSVCGRLDPDMVYAAAKHAAGEPSIEDFRKKYPNWPRFTKESGHEWRIDQQHSDKTLDPRLEGKGIINGGSVHICIGKVKLDLNQLHVIRRNGRNVLARAPASVEANPNLVRTIHDHIVDRMPRRFHVSPAAQRVMEHGRNLLK